MPITAITTMTADRASHAAEPPGLCGSSPDRARAPEIDWLLTYAGLPGLLVLKTTPVQYRTESCQSTMNPVPVTAANETAAVQAARRSRRIRKNRMKAAGVSLTAAARPTRVPRGQPGSGIRQSTVTRAISTMLTWPKLTVARTGSSASAAGNSHHRLSRDARERVNTRSTTKVSAMLASVSAKPATAIGTIASGDSSTAATGG